MNHPTRDSGVLLHPTSFPSHPGSGSFGADARDWIALLGKEGVGVWQLLPLAPTDGTGSPYSSPSGSALNPWLIDPDDLVSAGLISAADRDSLPSGPSGRLDPELAARRSEAIARALGRRWSDQPAARQQAFQRWSRSQAHWLRGHCLFMVLRRLEQGRPWWQWPAPLARRQGRALALLEREQRQALLEESLLQWQLQEQWQALRRDAQAHGVLLLGDLPFYVAHDSADVWCHPHLFSLGQGGELISQSGVPPDYFSATGQLWGTPVYTWRRHWFSVFRWWLARLERQLELFDRLRLDHFRALEAYWCVPGGDSTAENGHWRPSPGGVLLSLLRRRCRRQGLLLDDGRLPLIAEDLGVITEPVEALRDRFGLPGMKVLQFAFDGADDNPYLPANFQGSRWVVYTGTHDNATSLGWWHSLDHGGRERLERLVGGAITAPSWQLLEVALASEAELAVVPLQDLLELGDEARFNTPGTVGGNWSWRLDRPVSSLAGPVHGFGAMAGRYRRGASAAPAGTAVPTGGVAGGG